MKIDEEVLKAARGLAALRETAAGKVLSELARKALGPGGSAAARNGVPVLPKQSDAKPVTLKIVNRLRDAES